MTAATRWYWRARRHLARADARGDWSWCRPGVVNAVALPLDDGPIELCLAPGTARSALPRRWPFGLDSSAIRITHGERLQSQAAPATAGWPGGSDVGTVGALLQDRFDPSRHFALTCGHVFAGADGSPLKMGAAVAFRIASAMLTGRLRDWEPAFGAHAIRSGIDAALVDIDTAGTAALRNLGLPSGVSSDIGIDQSVVVQAFTPKPAELKTRWSGYVDVPGHASATDYYLDDAVAYRATPATDPGDSGAAVWDAKSRALLGVHVAAPIGDERLRSNAVYCPIGRIMDWFDVDAVTDAFDKTGPSLPRQPLVGAPAAALAALSPSEDALVVAKSVWGEARGEGHAGRVAVACVIKNRLDRRWLRAGTAAQVCRAPSQFSCWNADDPNRPMLDKIADHPDDAFVDALSIWADILAGRVADPTGGATHYYALSMRRAPFWAVGHVPSAHIGNQLFFNDIR